MSNAVQTYEQEQQRLQAEVDGGIHITIPQEPEVNPEVYRDVDPMLYRGFLTVSAEINQVLFVFKSLNHHELEMLSFCGGAKVSEGFWDTFLAYGVFMVGGVNILPDRDKWIPKIAEIFASLPKDSRARIIRHVSEVNRRASNAVVLTEAYAMEGVSRYRWLQVKGLDLTSVAITGIDGTQRLGLNWAQHLWRAVNHADDRNEQYEREWENAKFVGSCFAGKGISKVYAQDTERRRKEREERMARKDTILREIILGERVDPKNLMLPGAVVTAPRTVGELAEQLESDLRGNKDWHDKVIEDHETRIRANYNTRLKQVEEAAQETAAQFGGRRILGGAESLEGYTPEQVRQQVDRRQRQISARVPTVEADAKTQQFLDRWGATGPEVTSDVSTTNADITGAVPLPQTTRTPATPFRRK